MRILVKYWQSKLTVDKLSQWFGSRTAGQRARQMAAEPPPVKRISLNLRETNKPRIIESN